ncbi:IS4 family transposase [Mucilaginibacter celer]|uniref:IS4 family transposase n=1 Tax=Mucilaginibacter celer TaxID=2305508 RepID=A0A494VKT9_9SPHI|nr:IS4 family transposase [Mucilaginibacter celer]AYL94091.1 IS4 family transposase [Mucilaginibacter celer]
MLFAKGKAPFIFDKSRFVSDYSDTLNSSICSVIKADKIAELARQSGFCRRSSKLKPEAFIDTLVFNSIDHQISLQDCCDDLIRQSGKSLSKVGLHKRFNESGVEFMKLVLAEQMATRLAIRNHDTWQPFARVLITDSCKFCLPDEYKESYPGYGGAVTNPLMNIQYSFDLKNGDWENLELTKATKNDQSYSKRTACRIAKDDLHIRDLGYVTMAYLRGVTERKAFFLNRLQPKWKPVHKATGKVIDWSSLYERMRTNKQACFETEIVLGKGKKALECRLIVVPVAEQTWAERIRKAQKQAKSRGRELSEEYKQRCRFSVFITNVDPAIFNSNDVIELYRLRWQIELIFKSWKSLLNLHRVKPVKKERFECLLLARFIWILINWKIFRCLDDSIQKENREYACSHWKFFKQARLWAYALRMVMNHNITFEAWLGLFIFPIIKSLLIEPKKGKKASFCIVNDIFNPLS